MNTTPGLTAEEFNHSMRSLQSKLTSAVRKAEYAGRRKLQFLVIELEARQVEVQREIDDAVLARAEEIIKQRDEVARKAGELMAARRARRPEHQISMSERTDLKRCEPAL